MAGPRSSSKASAGRYGCAVRERALRRGAAGDAGEVLGSIRAELRAFTGKGANADDVTMVTVKRMAGA